MLLAAFAMLPLAGGAQAQGYPSKPLRMVVAFAPGGPTDAMARLIADKLGDKLGQRVIVENRPGGGGNIGYEFGRQVAARWLFARLCRPVADGQSQSLHAGEIRCRARFTPISLAVRGPTVMTVPAAHEARSVGEFIAFARSNAGKATYGSAGNGTPPHLNAEFFKASQGLDIVHVPYKGAAPAMIDLVAGRIDVMFLNIGSAKGQIESGTLRGLAVSGTARASTLPNVPTFREVGVPLPELDPGTWWGVAAPGGLPAEMTQKLNAAMRDALADPDLRDKLAKLNVDPTPSSPAEFEALIKLETKKWADVIKRAKITVE